MLHAWRVCAQWPARGRINVWSGEDDDGRGGVCEEMQRRFVDGAVFFFLFSLGYLALVR